MPTMQCRPPKLKFQFHTIPVNRRNVSHSRHSPHWGTTTHRNSSHFHRIRRKQNTQFVRLIISRRVGIHRQSTVAAAERSTTRATSKLQKEKNRKKIFGKRASSTNRHTKWTTEPNRWIVNCTIVHRHREHDNPFRMRKCKKLLHNQSVRRPNF